MTKRPTIKRQRGHWLVMCHTFFASAKTIPEAYAKWAELHHNLEKIGG